LAGFDPSEVSPVDTGSVGELLLTEPIASALADSAAQGFAGWLVRHDAEPSQSDRRLWSTVDDSLRIIRANKLAPAQRELPGAWHRRD
jgi:hypothetical protein